LTFRKSPVGALIVASIIRGYLPDYFSITFHIVSLVRQVDSPLEDSALVAAAALSIYSDVF